MIFMPLLYELCGCTKMLDTFHSSWLVASEVRTVPLIQLSTHMWTFALILFLTFETTKCIIVISYSRMFISRLLPGVVEALCYLATDQLCNPSEMFYILHWNTLERSWKYASDVFRCGCKLGRKKWRFHYHSVFYREEFYPCTIASTSEEAMASHSSTPAWKIPWMEEPGRLHSMGSLKVGHDWATSLSLFTFMHCRRKWQPTPVFLPGESQGRGSLVGCRLWGRTESDTTEVT